MFCLGAVARSFYTCCPLLGVLSFALSDPFDNGWPLEQLQCWLLNNFWSRSKRFHSTDSHQPGYDVYVYLLRLPGWCFRSSWSINYINFTYPKEGCLRSFPKNAQDMFWHVCLFLTCAGLQLRIRFQMLCSYLLYMVMSTPWSCCTSLYKTR